MTTLPVTESDLHAYVDGLLAPARQADVEAWLLARPDDAARVAAYRAQNAELHRLFDPVLDEAAPAQITVPARRRRGWTRAVGRCAAALAIALAGGAGGWMLRGASAPVPATYPAGGWQAASVAPGGLPRQAAVAHIVYTRDARHPVEIGADQEQHLVAWLSKRLGTPVRVPYLGKQGYDLIGGRLLPGESGPVGQFMYHNPAGARLTLYVSTGQSRNHDTGFRFAQEGPVGVFYWIDGGFGYALSAGTDRRELATIAVAVHEQLQQAH